MSSDIRVGTRRDRRTAERRRPAHDLRVPDRTRGARLTRFLGPVLLLGVATVYITAPDGRTPAPLEVQAVVVSEGSSTPSIPAPTAEPSLGATPGTTADTAPGTTAGTTPGTTPGGTAADATARPAAGQTAGPDRTAHPSSSASASGPTGSPGASAVAAPFADTGWPPCAHAVRLAQSGETLTVSVTNSGRTTWADWRAAVTLDGPVRVTSSDDLTTSGGTVLTLRPDDATQTIPAGRTFSIRLAVVPPGRTVSALRSTVYCTS